MTELDPAFSVHWLLEAVPATPGVSAGVIHVPGIVGEIQMVSLRLVIHIAGVGAALRGVDLQQHLLSSPAPLGSE